MLKITIAQMNPTVGDFEGILEDFRNALEVAKKDGANLLVTPELSICGYFPGDYLNTAEFIMASWAAEKKLKGLSKEYPDIHIVYGAPTPQLVKRRGKGFFNSLAVLKNGEWQVRYHKQLLPQYNIFDEARHFERGDRPAMLTIAGVKVGFVVCEDAWARYEQEYAVDPLAQLADNDVSLVVTINASPSNIGKRVVRHRLFTENADEFGFSMLYVNQVGGQESLVFDGGSFAVVPSKGVVLEMPRFEAATSTVEFSATEGFSAKNSALVGNISANDYPTSEFYFQQVCLGLKDYLRRCGFSKVLVGSSGGIDSALTIAIAALALGAENVEAITMPSVFSSEGSVSDSVKLCDSLGVKLHHFPIRKGVDWVRETALSSLGYCPEGLALENLQARIRGTLLMTHSNTTGAMLLTTGNKSEVSVGYCTLYGDTSGGLNLIGDLYKTEVFELARHLNQREGRGVIPQAIIDKEPSAELAPGQRDSDSLPPYEVLDKHLKLLIEQSSLSAAEVDELTAWEAEQKANNRAEFTQVRNRVVGLISRSEYKRKQAAPIIRVRGLAFGSGRRIPLAVNTDWLIHSHDTDKQ